MHLTVPLTPDDLLPLAEFGMRWRWTDPKWNLLDDDALSKIHPLTPGAARRAWETLGDLFDPSGFGLNPAHIADQTRMETADPDESVVRAFLERATPPRGDETLVLWGPDVAVLTTDRVFQRYWDDFCYPSSDDVLIWQCADAWAAMYWHEEVMFAGMRTSDRST
jgi:hypothetical protein